MKLIVDTSILIDNLRGGKIFATILDDLERENAELIVPTIVFFELFSGRSTRAPEIIKEINMLMKNFQRVDLTERIAKRAGELYRDINKDLGAADYVISASALELNATVVTLNKKHFEQITNLNVYPL
ncbi:MAG TPA: PIN domain-containing protein [Patescibacteria group bacterium]|nr:PIN domain-containing protein [Patescibacteria group bacterium]